MAHFGSDHLSAHADLVAFLSRLIRGHKEEKAGSKEICVKCVGLSVNRWLVAAGLDRERGDRR